MATRARIGDPTPESSAEEELSFGDLVRIAYRHRITLVSTTTIAVLLGILYLHFTEYKYTAEMQVAASQQDNARLSKGLGGLASIAGINLPQGDGVSNFTLYVKGLRSRQTASALTSDQALMRQIFASQWDEQSREWIEPSSVIRTVGRAVKSVLGMPVMPWTPPGAAEMEKYLKENVEIKEDLDEPILVAKFHHKDPEIARALLQRAHTATDEFLRQRTLERTTQYIAYLSNTLTTVTVAEHRQALVDALSEQEKLRMTASADLPFAAEPFGPIATSAGPTTPKPVLILFVSALLGFVVGALAVLFKESG